MVWMFAFAICEVVNPMLLTARNETISNTSGAAVTLQRNRPAGIMCSRAGRSIKALGHRISSITSYVEAKREIQASSMALMTVWKDHFPSACQILGSSNTFPSMLNKATFIIIAILVGTALQGQEGNRGTALDSPTLQDTTDWLSTRLLDVRSAESFISPANRFDRKLSISKAHFDGCAATLVTVDALAQFTGQGYTARRSEYTVYKFSLRDVSLGSVSVVDGSNPDGWMPRTYPEIRLDFRPGKQYHSTLTFRCTGPDCVRDWFGKDDPSKVPCEGGNCWTKAEDGYQKTQEGTRILLQFDPNSHDLATRISQALSHAVQLCGGVREVF